MYKINVLTMGRYYNVMLGTRRFFWRRKAKQFIKILRELDCEFTVEGFCVNHLMKGEK